MVLCVGNGVGLQLAMVLGLTFVATSQTTASGGRVRVLPVIARNVDAVARAYHVVQLVLYHEEELRDDLTRVAR